MGRLAALTWPGVVALAVTAVARVQPGLETRAPVSLALHSSHMLIVFEDCEHLVDPWRVLLPAT